MRVVLYAAVSHARTNELIGRSLGRSARRAAVHLYDRLAWRCAGRFTAHPYHYARHVYSNRGDEAIRVAIEHQLRSVLDPDIDYEELAWGELGPDEARRFDDGNTVLCVTGGGYYRIGPDGHVDRQLANDVEALSGTRCPVICFGAGVNRNIPPHSSRDVVPSAAAMDVLREHFRRVSYCAVRDEFSRTVLQPFSRGAIDVIADPVLFLEPRPRRTPPGQTLRVGVNLAFHGHNPKAVLALWIHAARDLLKSIEKRYRARFTYFVHSDVEHGIVRLLRDSGLQLDVVDTDPVSLADAYADIDVHICQMMHSSIMSTRLGIPTLVVAYDRKHYSFFDLLGLPEFCIPAETASLATLTMLFDDLVERREEIGAHLMARRSVLRRAHDAALSKLARSIDAICAPQRGVRDPDGDVDPRRPEIALVAAASRAPAPETRESAPLAAPAAARVAGRARR